jgi:hypothetical protein
MAELRHLRRFGIGLLLVVPLVIPWRESKCCQDAILAFVGRTPASAAGPLAGYSDFR